MNMEMIDLEKKKDNLNKKELFSSKIEWILFYVWFFLKKITSIIFSIIIFSIFSRLILSLFSNRGFSIDDLEGIKKSSKSNFFIKCDYKDIEYQDDYRWIDLINNSKARNEIKDKIGSVNLLKIYRKNSKESFFNKRNMIFNGPPGTGKSHCAELIAKNISSYYTIVSAGSLQEIFIGSGAKKWNKLISESIEKNLSLSEDEEKRPILIIVEEIDSLIAKGKHSSNKDDTLLNNFLGSVDSIKNNKHNILIIGTTNCIDSIEDAAKRSGRFDIINFGFPKEETDTDNLIESVRFQIEEEYFIVNSKKNEHLNSKKKIFIEEEYWSELKIQVFNLCQKYDLIFPEISSSVESTFLRKINSIKDENSNILIEKEDCFYTVELLLKSKNSQVNTNSEKTEEFIRNFLNTIDIKQT